MRVSIVHETVYRYRTPATYTIQYLRLWPRSSPRQRILSWKLDTPGPVRPWVDAFGNDAHVLVVDRPHEEIVVRARGQVEVVEAVEPDPAEDPGPLPPAVYLRYTRLTEATGSMAELADQFRDGVSRDRRAGLEALMLGVRERVEYRPGITHAATAAGEALAAGAGVCQDHAHLFIGCCRRLGLPARYVSGYLGASADGRMASHAWAEAWVDGEGWQGFDVANRVSPTRRHVRVAVGLDYLDACPIRGFRRGGADESLEVEVRVNDAHMAAEPPAPASAAARLASGSNGRPPGQQQQQQQQ
jgi:transglutaminase-like putative cysteine protease